jgi:DNA-directed RNA polymerase specialized sigma24 family protein
MNDDPPVHTTTTEGVTAPPDFTTFMRNYQDMVYSTAVRLIGNETQAEDIAQEVFIKAHAHFDNLRTSPSAGGWLKTVATNLSINHIQRYKKRWSFFSDLVHKDDEGGEGGRVRRARHVLRRRRFLRAPRMGRARPGETARPPAHPAGALSF